MNTENYGSLIKDLRIKNCLTQNQVAESLSITPGYISNVENNNANYYLIKCNDIA